MTARFFIVNPYSAKGGLITALNLARAAGTLFNPGSGLRPCSIEIPEKQEDADIVRELLKESQLEYHESPVDVAAY
jgi:hypothetical protein